MLCQPSGVAVRETSRPSSTPDTLSGVRLFAGVGTLRWHLHHLPRGDGSRRPQQEAALLPCVSHALSQVCIPLPEPQLACTKDSLALGSTLTMYAVTTPCAVFCSSLEARHKDACSVCRSWLERQQNCPTCRASVIAPPPASQAPAGQAGAPAAAGDPAAPAGVSPVEAHVFLNCLNTTPLEDRVRERCICCSVIARFQL